MDDTLVGRQLDEYRLLKLLGQGGMARVYLGEDSRLKRYVAIKVIDTPFRSDEQYIRRFEREARAVAQLEHPHIVRLYRYGETEQLFYMAMQYVEGTDLGTLLSSYATKGRAFPPADALRIIREVGGALDYAHSRSVIHRDVKPSNIILNDEGRAILADFGLALFAETGTRGEIFGTPQYIAPEQAISSANAVPQSDLYALGVILYEMFTGRLPFNAKEPSAEVEAVILKALAKDPADRYETGEALAQALEQALAQETPADSVASTRPGRAVPAPTEEILVPAAQTPTEPLARPESPATGPLQAAQERPGLRTPLLLLGCAGLVAAGILLLLGLGALLRRGDGEQTPVVVARETASPEPAPVLVPSPAATAPVAEDTTAAGPYRVRFVTNKNDSLFVVNEGEAALLLAPLQLGDGDNAIRGVSWRLVSLAPGACVSVWKETGRPRRPAVECDEVGERLTLPANAIFWDETFTVYYRAQPVGTCSEACTITDFPLH
jgi:tRNA A-37 threonylcarbamoyl transferase component Bud32